MSTHWEGIYCALWTPTGVQGELLQDGLRTNLSLLQKSGLQGLLILGSTGEFLHLDLTQRQRLIEFVMREAGSLQIIVNASDLRPKAVAELGRCAKQAGAAAVSLLPPGFYPVAQDDLVEHFVRGAEAAQLPLFLYNFPERTGNRISIETVAAVADRVPLAGVKQSGSEFEYHRALVELGRKKGFVVLTGADTRLPEALAMGVTGCVSGLANALPETVLQSFAESRQGNASAPKPNAQRLADLARQIQVLNFPLDVAACMEARGLVVGETKSVLSPQTQARRRELVAQLRRSFQEWKLI